MRVHVSPKQLAQAIEVSESSIKRWCDQGMIATVRTAGGHRRIPMTDVVRFLRANDFTVLRPEALGLPSGNGPPLLTYDAATDHLCRAVLAGDEEAAHQVVLDLLLANRPVVPILDDVIARALYRVGELWRCGIAEVFQERRACEITLRILHALQQILPAAPPRGRAIGGTPEGDAFQVPNAMVELCLRSCGWETESLGVSLPFPTLGAAIDQQRPQLFWLSVSHLPDEDDFVRKFNALHDTVAAEVEVLIGGRALTPRVRDRLRPARYCENLRQLELLARRLTVRVGAEHKSRDQILAAENQLPRRGTPGDR